MKKIITILILTFFSTGLWAQNFLGKDYDFRLGLTATPTFGWISPEQGKSNGIALGFSYGLMGDFNFAPNYSFATSFTITTINGKSTEVDVAPYQSLKNTSNPNAYDLKYRMQYIEIPLTIKLKTNKMGEVRWYGQFGLSNDFKISAKQNAVLPNGERIEGQGIGNYTRFYRAGLIVGGGGEFDVATSTSLTVGLTLNNGFTNVVTDKTKNVKNHYMALNLGLFF